MVIPSLSTLPYIVPPAEIGTLSLVTPEETLKVCNDEGPVDKVTIEGEVAMTTANTTSSMSWKLWGFPTGSEEAMASLGWGLAHR